MNIDRLMEQNTRDVETQTIIYTSFLISLRKDTSSENKESEHLSYCAQQYR